LDLDLACIDVGINPQFRIYKTNSEPGRAAPLSFIPTTLPIRIKTVAINSNLAAKDAGQNNTKLLRGLVFLLTPAL
jgi:hypothetical protein